MKTKLALLVSFAAALAAAPAARAADAYKPTQLETYALEFVEKNDKDTGLDDYIADDLGLAKGGEADTAVRASVKAMLAVKSKGYKPGKRAFWDQISARPSTSPAPANDTDRSDTPPLVIAKKKGESPAPSVAAANEDTQVANEDPTVDDELKAWARVLKKKIADQEAIVANQARSVGDKKAATKDRDALQLQLTSNLAAQAVIAKTREKAAADAKLNASPDDALLKAIAAQKKAELSAAQLAKAAADQAERAVDKADETLKNTVGAAVQKAFKVEKEAVAHFQNYQAFFHLGANLLNPYDIVSTDDTNPQKSSGPKKISTSSSTEVGGFLEFVYSNRWAWNEDRITRPLLRSRDYGSHKNLAAFRADQSEDNQKHIADLASREPIDVSVFRKNCHGGGPGLLSEFDVQLRFGYNFTGGSELTANTLTGSSDINAELDVGVPLFRGDFVSGAYSVGPEVSYSATTEKKTLDVHHRWFAGLSYTTAFESVYETDLKRRILVHSRFGYAKAENVRFVNDVTREIITVNDGTPRYYAENALAFETEIFFPVRTYSFLTLGARVYGVPRSGPNPWNLYIGFTTPLAQLIDGIVPK